ASWPASAPIERGDQRALRQHPRDPPPIVGSGVQISIRGQRLRGRLRRLPQPGGRRLETEEQTFAGATAHRRRSDTEEAEARAADASLPVEPQEGRATGEGEITVTSGDFREAPPSASGRQR